MVRGVVISSIMVGVLAAGPAWALFESNKELVAGAKIPLEEAVKSAIKAVPGKAAEADLGKDDGRTIWKIEVIDHNNKSQTVYVDAQTGMAKMNK
ncbi:MAG TPA: PepSY domain-containing protein [Anaerolineales bacterium]